MIDVVKRVAGIDFNVQDIERRAGDPPVLVADNGKIQRTLNWSPKHDSLEYLIKTSWEWEKTSG